MEIKPLQLQQNKLMNHYRNEHKDILKHFDYNPYTLNTYEHRLTDLGNRPFNRERLSDILYDMNKKWNASEDTFNNIKRLKDENSVVAVGGQQAGLLSGPSYTIHKIISIIQFAKQQEKSLQIPVIPVFWIAGEDHDFAEINHIFMPQISTMEKHKLLQRVSEKWSVSDIPIEEEYAKRWLKQIFGQLKETEYTHELYQTVMKHVDKSTTYVDFFARMIYALFQREGIVQVDSHDPEMRAFESDFFVMMINKQERISAGVFQEQEKLQEEGYQLTLEVEESDSHLFYHHNNERVLLMKTEDGHWTGKQNEVSFTTDELLQVANETPDLLSNNVVTRPIMQEMVLPTLAFIGGPGEVNYWSMLKPAFHEMGIKMPPVLPRLSFTYVEPHVQKLLSRYDIPIRDAIENGTEQMKVKWLEDKNDPSVKKVSWQVKEAIEEVHQPLRDVAARMRNDIRDLADKNLQYLKYDIEFLEKRMTQAIEEKYEKEIYEFDVMDIYLHPLDGLQERVWNPIVWVNCYGTDFINQLTQAQLSFADDHYVVYI